MSIGGSALPRKEVRKADTLPHGSLMEATCCCNSTVKLRRYENLGIRRQNDLGIACKHTPFALGIRPRAGSDFGCGLTAPSLSDNAAAGLALYQNGINFS